MAQYSQEMLDSIKKVEETRKDRINILLEKVKEEEIKACLKLFIRRFFTQQFKRNCLPDGIKVGSVSLSPRGDLRMSSDTYYGMYLKELENL